MYYKTNNMEKASVKFEKAIFAGGCFWCVAEAFSKIDGVKKVISGYTGGNGQNPNYEDYASKGFIEAIQITYDPEIINYDQLLELFWKQIDPADSGGQFSDRGPQYRSAIFYRSENQKQEAIKSKSDIEKSGMFKKPLATEIIKASKFYPAEQYHQDYHEKNPVRYKFYRLSCGRDGRLREIWG
jgi:peptide methionine sulfoxide reductase msrA/msrB